MKQIFNGKYAGLFLFMVCVLVPSRVYGAVLITEIMYDLPSSDTGREWVEVTNTSTSGVDITGYKLSEGGTNHALTVLSGNGTLAAGQSAVIVSSADKFASDWPQFNGGLFKASFSLSNTGETVSLKDSSLVLLDSASYTSDAGAAGDGNTLHRVNDTLVAGAADPGVYTSQTPPAPTPDPTPTPDPAPAQAVDTTPAADTSASSTSNTTTDTTPAVTDTTPTPTNTSTESAATQPTSASTVVATVSTPTPTSQTSAQQASAQTQTTSTKSTSTPTPAPTKSATNTAPTTTPVQTSSAPVAPATHAVSVAAAVKTSPSSKTGNAKASSGSSPFGNSDTNTQVAAVSMAPMLQNIPSLWLYALGLVALLAVAVGAVLYVKPHSQNAVAETTSTSEEFELE